MKRPGICAAAKERRQDDFNYSHVTIEDGRIIKEDLCNVELEVGQLVAITYLRITNKRIDFWCKTIEPVAVTRGIGAFKDTYAEDVSAGVFFKFDESDTNTGDPTRLMEAIEEWFVPFETYAAAKEFSNGMKTDLARGQIVDISEGMSIAEVERLLGLPEKRATIGAKIIFKYPDVTVEFTNGKVTDVKF